VISERSHIAQNIDRLNERISAACQKAGRDVGEVRLVAVSKTVGLSEIREALAYGVRDFGENRSPSLVEKQDELKADFNDIRWHFIGHIQSNKVKEIVGRAALIHSVASEHIALAISQRAELMGVRQPVLLEVNTSGEPQKDGVSASGLAGLLDLAMSLKGLQVRGLMTMAAIAEESGVRASFRALKRLFEESRDSLDVHEKTTFDLLSMGMTDDFEIAIAEGATILRIGRAVWE